MHKVRVIELKITSFIKAVMYLGARRDLQHLHLYVSADISADIIRLFPGRWSSLQEFHSTGAMLDQAAVCALGRWAQLRQLCITSSLRESGLKHFGHCHGSRLEELEVRDCYITEYSIRGLVQAYFLNLQELYFIEVRTNEEDKSAYVALLDKANGLCLEGWSLALLISIWNPLSPAMKL